MKEDGPKRRYINNKFSRNDTAWSLFHALYWFAVFSSLLCIETADRPGLVVEMIKVMADINIDVESAEIDTEVLKAHSPFRNRICCGLSSLSLLNIKWKLVIPSSRLRYFFCLELNHIGG